MSKDNRVHDHEATHGDLGEIPNSEVLGQCPSCEAEIRGGNTWNPDLQCMSRVVMHPIPFCSYFGNTAAGIFEAEVKARMREN